MRRLLTSFRSNTQRDNEHGIVILLVAVVMLFVVGAMAALSIDVATLYTARSEAQLAADAAALAGARVLANSGATSDTSGTAAVSMLSAWRRARAIAFQVAEQNQVGGANLTAPEVTIPDVPAGTIANPIFIVRVQKNDLPTFFARIWGRTQLTVVASATAEAYNPSTVPGTLSSVRSQVAPMCVKPWLLPNIDPSNATPGSTIFDPTMGTINAGSALLGWGAGSPISPRCVAGDCTGPPTPPVAWQYYPGNDATFPPPAHSIPTCVPVDTYQESLAGCTDTPISCNATVNIDPINHGPVRDADTTNAIGCLTHATTNPLDADQVDLAAPVGPPFQFLAGTNNPLALANPSLVGQDVMVSSSLVTVPVFDVGSFIPPSNSVNIVGFVQLFLNPDGLATPTAGNVNATVINLVGCGAAATSPPILGNGASPVMVRLISPAP